MGRGSRRELGLSHGGWSPGGLRRAVPVMSRPEHRYSGHAILPCGASRSPWCTIRAVECNSVRVWAMRPPRGAGRSPRIGPSRARPDRARPRDRDLRRLPPLPQRFHRRSPKRASRRRVLSASPPTIRVPPRATPGSEMAGALTAATGPVAAARARPPKWRRHTARPWGFAGFSDSRIAQVEVAASPGRGLRPCAYVKPPALRAQCLF